MIAKPKRALRLIRRRSMGRQKGPCSYCGNMYDESASVTHFIPCTYCDSLEHAGCQH